jgi:hypothetical protein
VNCQLRQFFQPAGHSICTILHPHPSGSFRTTRSAISTRIHTKRVYQDLARQVSILTWEYKSFGIRSSCVSKTVSRQQTVLEKISSLVFDRSNYISWTLTINDPTSCGVRSVPLFGRSAATPLNSHCLTNTLVSQLKISGGNHFRFWCGETSKTEILCSGQV